MCGIAGIIATGGSLQPNSRETVARMNAALTHRGPDEAGAFADDFCALAMRRLSIIDLEGGTQPLTNEDGSVLVFMNGELYNHRELRTELKKQGHQFATASDTEVLVHLYEQHGTEMLPMLRGMFAFCLYDKAAKTWLLARDRFGEKPLFYHAANGQFSFASELTALLENPAISRVASREALAYYFRTSLLPEPLTHFENVHSLPPGHFVQLGSKASEPTAYFEIEYQENPTLATKLEAMAHIELLLKRAVAAQSVSDVPIGCFLSGGIDSSTTVALLQQQQHKPIQTFNVKFETAGYDESAIAREVAAHCGTEHHEIVLPEQQFSEALFWEIIERVGQPFRDSSAIPTYLISREIRKHVKVAISGDGGDEVFGGYALFQWYTRILKTQQIPRPLRAAAGSATALLQKSDALPGSGKVRQLHRAFQTSLLEAPEIAIALNEQFTEQEMQAVWPDFAAFADGFARLKHYPPAAADWSPLRQIMYYRTAHTLPGNMLVKVDRMSMANSLEVRAPFLDADLFAAAARLPDELLIHQGKGKYLLREIMKPHLPEAVFSHPKQGFNLPLHSYRNAAYRQLAQRLLFDENPWPGFFPTSALEAIFTRGLEQQKDTASMSIFRATHQLWMLMQLLGWAKRFNVQPAK